MRTTKKITISDNGNSYEYVLTKMSAIGLQKWTARALTVLIETGILEQNAVSNDFLSNMRVLFENFNTSSLTCLGKINCDRLDAVVFDLVNKTAERVVGASHIKVTESDLEATLENIGSLLTLEKECLLINFPMFATVAPSDSQHSDLTENTTSQHKTLIRPSQS